eukprot:Clim_evm48s151 gene=Clim_evmTU48s151
MPTATLDLKNQDESKFDRYYKLHDVGAGKENVEERKNRVFDMVNDYYDLATDFYEYGWGKSFHFSLMSKNETLDESIKRHEFYLALRMGMKEGMEIIDLGCGVGGPARNIARFSGATVTGLNNNEYQVKKCNQYNKAENLDHLVTGQHGSFMEIPAENGSYDGAYEIEATCHAPDKVACYREIFRVLKPGSYFAGWDWCLTDRYDPENEEHRKIKAEIEVGNGLPDILTTADNLKALKEAGFEIEDEFDGVDRAEVPWYEPLEPSRLSLSGFRTTALGRFCTRNLVWALETAGIAPKGSSKTSAVLETAADALVAGGKLGIFTPMHFTLARKPVVKAA